MVCEQGRVHRGPQGDLDAIFFDLDGTLIDSRAGTIRTIQHVLNSIGVSPALADGPTAIDAPTIPEIFMSMLDDEALVEVAVKRYRKRHAEVGLYECRLYDGVSETLGRLSGRGIRLFVATSRLQVFAERIIDHLGLSAYFDGVFGTSPSNDRESKGDLLRRALRAVDMDPNTSAMVGDRAFDMQGATENGMRALGVLYGYGSREELDAAGAQLLVSRPGEIIDILAA